MLRRLIAATALSLLIVSLAAGRQGKGKGKGLERDRTAVGVEVFAAEDRRVMHDYVMGYRGRLPPGLAKRNGDLPPGLEKQLRRNGRLPPGLEKRLMPCPPELDRRLSPLAPGLARGFISGRAVIYNPSTRVVFDIFVPLQ